MVLFVLTPGSHADFAPSSDDRVYDCPASWKLNRALPDTNSVYSAQGTFAHLILDLCCRENLSPWDRVGDVAQVQINGVTHEFLCDEEMAECLEEVMARYHEIPGDHYYERKIDVSRWTPMPKQFGTSDHVVCSGDTLFVDDLKYGEGVRVWAERNRQLAKYAVGVLDDLDWAYGFQRVVLRIMQPRLDHYDQWETTPEELRQIANETKLKMHLAMGPNAPFGPSEKACRFCKVAATCSALQSKVNAAAGLVFDDLGGEFTPGADMLPVSALVETWHARKLYDIRFNAVEERLTRLMLAGDDVPGLKTVEGRTHRRWASDAAALEAMDKVCIPKAKRARSRLISPAQALKLVPVADRKTLKAAIIKPQGAPTIVSVSDPRAAFGVRADEVFDDFDQMDDDDDDFSF